MKKINLNKINCQIQFKNALKRVKFLPKREIIETPPLKNLGLTSIVKESL